jgi:CO/xanthine dehydrogenase FAD-binding subunit
MEHFLGSFSLPEVIYHKPAAVPDALALLSAHHGKCLLLAGCTDIIPMIRRGKLKLSPGTHLIDLKGIKRLGEISMENGKVTVGAAASYTSIIESGLIAKACPLLAQVSLDIGSAQIRNTGTIGGNLVTASPGGDACVALLALGAEVLIAGAGAEKTVPLTEFFTGYGTTVLGAEEIVTAVRFPAMSAADRSSWIKLGRRNAFTMSVLSVATLFRLDNAAFDTVRLAMGLAGPTPRRIVAVEQFLQGKQATAETVAEAAEIAAQAVQPRSSFRASAEYRIDMARVLTRRALAAGLDRVQA